MGDACTGTISSGSYRRRYCGNYQALSMGKRLKIFTVYFPVMLVAGQVIVNLMYFLFPDAYYASGFYLNTFFGTNVFFAIFLTVFTFKFHFCKVSRYAAVAELLFAVNYMVVQQDNLYNILFQVIVGLLALIATFFHYVNKFPMCRLSLLVRFYKKVIQKCSCEDGLNEWEKDVRGHLLKRHHG